MNNDSQGTATKGCVALHTAPLHKARLAVLVSGHGSNLQAIIDACAAAQVPAEVALVVSNRRHAYGLVRAQQAAVPTLYFPLQPYLSDGRGRAQYDADLAEQVAACRPDWICLAGWMHVLGNAFVQRFPGRVINLHPALPATFPGVNAIARAYQAFRAGKTTETGVMLHLVPDEGVDVGPVIASERVPIDQQDTLESLEQRVHQVEHRLYVQALNMVIARAAKHVP